MSQIEKNIITTPSISKVANAFNNLLTNNTMQAMKMAAYWERQINEAEKKQEEIKANPVIKEEIVPTGAEIRQDREEGEYR